MNFGQSLSATALRSWATVKGVPRTEFEIPGLRAASKVLAGKTVSFAAVGGEVAVSFKDVDQKWKAVWNVNVTSLAITFVRRNSLLQDGSAEKPMSMLVTFPANPAKVRDFLRIGLRTDATWQRAGEAAGVYVVCAQATEWLEAQSLMPRSDRSEVALYLGGFREEARAITRYLIGDGKGLEASIAFDAKGVSRNGELILPASKAIEKMVARGIQSVNCAFDGFDPAALSNASGLNFVGSCFERTLRLLDAIGIQCFGTVLGTYRLSSGRKVTASINQLSLGDVFIRFELEEKPKG